MAVVKDGHILLVRQTYQGESLWTLPGGGIEPGESPEKTAIREVKEEVHLDTRILRLLYTGPRQRGTGTYFCYLGEIVGGELRLGADPELSEDAQELRAVRWWPLDAVSEHPEVSLILPALLSPP
ncbi:MAG TPA: NUDIX hydrolase [Candidatus Hydrogenedentes bacterium]|nr:NUDIX hydrolase [Candidatus Hydrogenedentota bacterium]